MKKVEEEQTITRLHVEIRPTSVLTVRQLWGGQMYETEEKKLSRLQQKRLNKSVCLKRCSKMESSLAELQQMRGAAAQRRCSLAARGLS